MEVTDVFGPGASVIVNDIQCNGTEKEVQLCVSAGNDNSACENDNHAGAFCSRSFGE